MDEWRRRCFLRIKSKYLQPLSTWPKKEWSRRSFPVLSRQYARPVILEDSVADGLHDKTAGVTIEVDKSRSMNEYKYMINRGYGDVGAAFRDGKR